MLFCAWCTPVIGLYATPFSSNATYQVCFTPKGQCTQEIVEAINQAQSSIYVQAYSFTSMPIAKALIDKAQQGIRVYVLVDKSQSKKNRYTVVPMLQRNNIPVWIDRKPAIAHNKIIVIDEERVITGSFNYTKAAQEHNAENVLLIHDRELAVRYLTNWEYRKSVSEPAIR